MVLWLLFIGILGAIYYFGTSGFGRSQTQQWIDKFKRRPRLWNTLNRYHGTLRAAFHYVEFGSCYIVLYPLLCGGSFRWRLREGLVAMGICYVLAVLDEWHQARTKGRCFRRIDLMHSFMGISAIMFFLYLLGPPQK